MDTLDDAGVYRISRDMAIIQTIDFFTPIVDDPYAFGQIAVANSLSDVYAMGGKPLTALNIVCFPIGKLDISVLRDILKGGIDKMLEAKVTLLGGHSIDDPELKYGLSVTGAINPRKLVTTSGAKPGDEIILTKPLGTGIITTALKAGIVDKELAHKVAKYMATLNGPASTAMQEVGVHACTDITGFGFLGHALKVAENSKVGMEFKLESIPYFPEVEDFSRKGLCPGGLGRNKDYYSSKVSFNDEIPDHIRDVLFDAQTSGGLLICVSSSKAQRLLRRLHQAGVADAAIIGEVVNRPRKVIIKVV
jgi:selenide,water dikinase